MTGAEYVAEFLARRGVQQVFLLTGGACAFMVDAVANHPKLGYLCFQHEQGAAMAADAVWRTSGKVGVAMATSGPGATNLLTGIACAYFDSIPSLFITGQVNMRESAGWAGAKVRQFGFQETRIVEMAAPITKYAVLVRTAEELKRELAKAFDIALEGRGGPVLIDIPMDVQQLEVGDDFAPPAETDLAAVDHVPDDLLNFFDRAERPVLLFGAGIGLARAQDAACAWLKQHDVPFVASWNALTYFDHAMQSYCGAIGVYGNRGANAVIQNADAVLVLGSRLDNRQRSGNARSFAPDARVHVVDIDAEELVKYKADGYGVTQFDLRELASLLSKLRAPTPAEAWCAHVSDLCARYRGRSVEHLTGEVRGLSPYAVVQELNRLMKRDAIVACDTGAALCWVFQMFHRSAQTLFTAGGNSPMGYAVPAAIGAAITNPGRQVFAFIGDGGFQLNIQELQTIAHYGLDVVIVVMNNGCYGMIRQFQDSYLGGRYHATIEGYSAPDFSGIVAGYGLAYHRVERLQDLSPALLSKKGGVVIDVIVPSDTQITPKLEMGRPINDQYPYLDDEAFRRDNPYWNHPRYPRA
ncbi:putative acetolactate synthase I, large subunit [Bradyrhizobium sp. STM 3843]|uniref:thiamine pyrophosphate-binding protein n=1 Tax=Bradyrhizobium sp. STM 3843 TaxID=551947 RepID=UPI000240669F|nr:thiamine pyrophosphate-binding protein [Bradyrhizobium sp. STM 3843]CCE04763.1 putative acetolactate synthase I, large subunit [Bradyrhizobium sp. STM 3843]